MNHKLMETTMKLFPSPSITNTGTHFAHPGKDGQAELAGNVSSISQGAPFIEAKDDGGGEW